MKKQLMVIVLRRADRDSEGCPELRRPTTANDRQEAAWGLDMDAPPTETDGDSGMLVRIQFISQLVSINYVWTRDPRQIRSNPPQPSLAPLPTPLAPFSLPHESASFLPWTPRLRSQDVLLHHVALLTLYSTPPLPHRRPRSPSTSAPLFFAHLNQKRITNLSRGVVYICVALFARHFGGDAKTTGDMYITLPRYGRRSYAEADFYRASPRASVEG
ncbi:hypothetical protein BDK51DRAFT_44615 [Blyttiomyces helicus]|uniref:Uncharacterized protein n=1 Tax=Blyttiomyces helicus TaxID=388810 RepID=A0A4P9WM16_9FUNG|nr:hypothetical protein BDK51DRAFT_44615 [Blyttiomyces helicus]|eukprot:RKO92200.1 hypothetical protein BDK51DRAFT_44615 [Blyttiomyces helicus]